MPTLLVRYGEIGLKSASVRRRFEQQLVADIRTRHVLAKVPCVISQTRGRLFVDSDDWRRSCEILSRTLGIVSFSPVTQVTSELNGLTDAVVAFAEPLLFKGASFAIRSRRSGNHDYTSQTLAEHLGEAILIRYKDKGIRVALDEPDVELFVEVREKSAYLFSSVFSGPGGMPLGTQGRMLCVLDSENAIASTWLMMKRGCSVLAATVRSDLAEPLRNWYPNLKLTDPKEDLMSLAQENECIGITLSWGLIEIEKHGGLKGDVPVFYPLVGMNKEEIEGLLARIRG